MAKGTAGNKVRTITCVACGTVKTGRMTPGRLYCSLPCYRLTGRPTRKTGAECICETCSKPFYAPRNRLEVARFCSTACADVWQGRNKTTHTCKTCGKAFRWSPSRQKANNVTYCSIPCRNADPARREQLIALNAAQQKVSPTTPERIGYAILDRLGITYECQAVIGGKFTVDAALPESRLVIQFDGDYWHDRSGTSKEPRIRKRVRLDRSQDAYMAASGWRVLRLWEGDLKQRPEWCTERISQHLRPPS
jgi:DNA mismatch endonuclease (patch repair protein)